MQCDGTVGFGGSPDESSETTLDAMIMDGDTMAVGSVGNLRRVKNAIGVARAVLDYTTHSIMAGDQATTFAIEMGFPSTNLSTAGSINEWQLWRNANCQPNYRQNVTPNPTTSCGPYKPITNLPNRRKARAHSQAQINKHSHDTIAMIAIDSQGHMASGTSTNGASHKVPGRVGDSPIVGAGSYVDSDVGGCGATGDGDIMMRFLPAYQAVESMRRGMTPTEAADDAFTRIRNKYPYFQGGLVCLNATGGYGGASNGWVFVFAVKTPAMPNVELVYVSPPVEP
jgi:N4-(beta-N-acetylglucosaminyl)-L-asparaginase